MAAGQPYEDVAAMAELLAEHSAQLEEVATGRVTDLEDKVRLATAAGRSQKLHRDDRQAATRAARTQQTRLDQVKEIAGARREALDQAAIDIAELLGEGR